MSLLRKFLKGYVENFAARVFGNMFWPPVSVAVLAHGENDDILTINEDRTHSLPGGIINSGEDFREAAAREVKEETGFEVDIGELLDIRFHTERPGIQVFFEARVIGGERDGSWEGEPEFIAKEEMEEKVWELEHSHVHEYLFPDGG